MRKIIVSRRRSRPPVPPARNDDRTSGEEEFAGHQASAAEATPSHMNRLKTFRL